MKQVLITFLLALLLLPIAAMAKSVSPVGTPPASDNGDVRVPLAVYQQLVEAASQKPQPAPASYAIGNAKVKVSIKDLGEHTTATVTVTAEIKTFEDQWTLVPILPHGAALTETLINNHAVQLVQGAQWLSWGTKKAGTAALKLVYHIDASRSENGYVLPLTVPSAAATQLELLFPGEKPDLAIIPSADSRSTAFGGGTKFTASIPATSSVLVSWRIPSKQNYAISRAFYQGELKKSAITWTTDFDVEVFSGESVKLKLMPSHVTLSGARINKKQATLLEEDGYFAVIIKGRGKYSIQTSFQTSVKQEQGPPITTLNIPRVPVSRFELTLPGKKQLTVTPETHVDSKTKNNKTIANVYIPMRDNVSFSWLDAIPEEQRVKVRANANIYHAIHAEEGVLHVNSLMDFNVTHGEATTFSFDVPNTVQVNRVSSGSGGVSDWTEKPNKGAKGKRIQVFLDRAVKGRFVLDVNYESLLKNKGEQSIHVPLIHATDMHRQRGMVALLAGTELALKPITENNISRVGENQLPGFVKNSIQMGILHTYKYTSDKPQLLVQAVAPERKQGKFDAQVDTLFSIGEVTVKGNATVQLDVKSGSTAKLVLNLPLGVNLLSVAGPSLRSYDVKPGDTAQTIQIEFTQPMEGQFRLEVNYEQIMKDGIDELAVPTLGVEGAEVEHGRLAVEALTAVEVQTSKFTQLTTVDINELPQQLVLKTTNPILLAFKYVHAKPPYELSLKITRHKEILVQEASIETAEYQSLVTNDGLVVTTAKYLVRNSRRQFLRLSLPAESEVWSVFVDNQAEKPASASEDSNGILIKMINSTSGFPVEIVYATPISKLSMMGSIGTHLPLPDMVVTKTHWNVFVPFGPDYVDVESNMDIIARNARANPRDMTMHQSGQANKNQAGAFKVNVPTQGIRFEFAKLYANKSQTPAFFTIRYTSVEGKTLGIWVSIIGVLLIWLAIFLIKFPSEKLAEQNRHKASWWVLGSGFALVLLSIGYLGTSLQVAATTALLGAVVFIIKLAAPVVQRWRS
ncbi:MAG: hypothetical protein OEZ68_06495 [Gammaproteobacteria bacterium]|nr:hypothetical protein [Gammaproteobacteria bacterium]MDH5800439.1 hypothetical protein [Gammaproteobacteria bacterium]